MPLDIVVTYKDGSQQLFYIPLRIMRGEKENETDLKRNILSDWPWTHPVYEFEATGEISTVEIDPSKRMADVNRENNKVSME